MTKCIDLLNRFKTINLRDKAPEIIADNSAELIDLNLYQLERGLTSDNKKITPGYRNAKYAAYKAEENSQAGFGVPDLRLTGNFYAGFYVKVTKTMFELGSNDEKSLLLEGKYSGNGNIFGLTNDSKTQFARQVIRPKIIFYIEECTGLKAH